MTTENDSDARPVRVGVISELNSRELPSPERERKILSGIRRYITAKFGWLSEIRPETCHYITLRGRVSGGRTQYVDAYIEADDEGVTLILRVSEDAVPDPRNPTESSVVAWRWDRGECVALECPGEYFEWVVALPWLAERLPGAMIERVENERAQLRALAEIESLGDPEDVEEGAEDDLEEEETLCETCECNTCECRKGGLRR